MMMIASPIFADFTDSVTTRRRLGSAAPPRTACMSATLRHMGAGVDDMGAPFTRDGSRDAHNTAYGMAQSII